MKHVPERTCIVCRSQRDKSELIRIVKTKDGAVVVDTSGKAAGRGAYVCRSSECISALAKKRALNRSLKTELNADVYAELEKELKEIVLDGQ